MGATGTFAPLVEEVTNDIAKAVAGLVVTSHFPIDACHPQRAKAPGSAAKTLLGVLERAW